MNNKSVKSPNNIPWNIRYYRVSNLDPKEVVHDNTSIANSTYLFGGKPSKSSGNTSGYSITMGISSIFTSNLCVAMRPEIVNILVLSIL